MLQNFRSKQWHIIYPRGKLIHGEIALKIATFIRELYFLNERKQNTELLSFQDLVLQIIYRSATRNFPGPRRFPGIRHFDIFLKNKIK